MRIVLTWVFAVSFITICLLGQSYWEDHSKVVGGSLYCLACVLVGCCVGGRLWCSIFIAGYKNSSLITTGPYSLCRNPLYFFSWLGGIGVAMGSETLTLPIVVAIAFLIYYPFVIESEERVLEAQHGDEFRAYMRTTPRFFPNFRHFVEPNNYIVNPITIRKHIADAVWFMFFLGGLEVIESLHDSGLIVEYFSIF